MNKISVFFLLITFLILACQEDQLTITTTSDLALQNFLKARELFEKVNYQDATPYLETAVKEDSMFAMAYLFLAQSRPSATERFAMIEKAKSLSDHVSKGERLIILGSEAGALGNTKKQEQYFQELVETYPKDKYALIYLANYYFGQRDYEKSLIYYKRIVQVDPNYSIPYNQMGYIYRYQEDYAAAEESFKKYIKLIPDDPNPYDSYAELLLKMGEYEVSIENYEKALEIDPDFMPSHRGIATNLVYMREYKKARGQLKHLYKIAQDDNLRINAHFWIAVSYLAEGNVDMALEEIEKLYQRAEAGNDVPSMIGNMYTRTVLLFENGRLAEAESLLAESREMWESADLAPIIKENLERGYWFQKARLALKKNQLNEAKQYSEKYHEKAAQTENPMPMRYYHTLIGMIAHAEKDYNKAISEFQQSNLEDPFNRYQLAQAYIAKDDKDMAIKELDYVVNYNDLMNLGYTMVRSRAEKQLGRLKMEYNSSFQ
jgi:tetratricopeptide (TPR) repeat protein